MTVSSQARDTDVIEADKLKHEKFSQPEDETSDNARMEQMQVTILSMP